MPVTNYNTSDAVMALPIATRTANTTVNGTTVDRTDTNATVMFAVNAGTITDGSVAITIQESDDNSTWANAASTDIQGGPTLTFATAQSNTVAELGYTGRKRYVRITHIQTGATSGGAMGAVAVLAGGRKPNWR